MNDESYVARSVGRYQVLEELGRGAMGVVYRGFDPVIRRTVALKTMAFSPQDAESQALRERLYREAAAAGTLTHPNIVTIYDIIDDGSTTAVAMEFVEGQTLADVLASRGALPIDEALGIFEPICAALDYAGSKGIVHRDIKPANILLTVDGRPKIMDFGIARMAMQGQTQTSTIMGSPSYMSPEQVRGLPLGPRSDLFSAAVVFFEMIAGERPFGGDDVATTMYRIVNEPPRALDQRISTINPSVGSVLEWALSKNPADRYQTGGELLTALREALGSGAVASAPPNAEMVVVRNDAYLDRPANVSVPRRSPMLVYGVIGSALLLLVVVLAIVFGGGLGDATTNQAMMSGGATAPDSASAGTSASPSTAEPPTVADGTSTAAVPNPAAPGVKEPGRAMSIALPEAAASPSSGRAGSTKPKAESAGAPSTAALAAAMDARISAPTAPSSPVAPPPPTSASAPPPTAVPPPAAAPPPPVATAVAVGVASAVFVVKGEDYSGVRILLDDRLLPGPYPAQVAKIAAGAHRVVYRWVSGTSAGHEIAESIVVSAGGHFIIRAALDSEKLVVQQLR